jgi:hypothetical protein
VNKPVTITATVPAYLMPHHRVTTLLERVRTGRPCTDMLCFWTFAPGKDYTRVGDAQITLELGTEDTLVSAQIQALKAEIDRARAQFLEKQQECLEQIQKLSALPMADVVVVDES